VDSKLLGECVCASETQKTKLKRGEEEQKRNVTKVPLRGGFERGKAGTQEEEREKRDVREHGRRDETTR
jgi:hypothetical protein